MIVQFPVKKQMELPENIEKDVEVFAEQYVQMLHKALVQMAGEDFDQEKADEAMALLMAKLFNAFDVALEKEFES